MSDVLSELQGRVFFITLNRIDKYNAFDELLLEELQKLLDEAKHNHEVRVIVLKANGKHFSAGADLNWMQRMAGFSEAENLADATILARLMFTLNQSPKPTIAMVQGSAFGGGAGLIAACDIGIAADTARFCFSEVKLGLIPAVISPYVINAIGARAAAWLFMSAEMFDAKQALRLNLIQHCVPESELYAYTLDYAQKLAELAPLAVQAAKALVAEVADESINEQLLHKTAALIAKKRVSAEGQRGLQAFLNKETPVWD
ncbi:MULTISPECIES: enoyl-CoA hydratase-related protein [Legionella]|uniref:Gamma-carboxygeranoyl-CoA hydratase n=1 Tax=Legionella septentrionalis TaxID=2498109 RepID=A0A433JKI0_9GAMM|nr:MULTISPECIES: enoyl-CoA hydratase-related protein [Legionella]MCP0914209.1 enoyl-CoA hydratase-related protein [Legionella sp. 27cVA30]RUQ89215.1 gamma-carboxygeranoyl-CoA hydratase [Legionella septentrionalis]RUR00550.1 gamma-carboxygeranoyl-CoA hydratase [Legionella septentrionalis]RUR11751.1 gamma-carboxygeranoyl-CoA hydratase [Legionella septentrionalis]RUR17439.1 gamma-carboxygeranoyl-CoA hydratase [Legionella septentrionalis]